MGKREFSRTQRLGDQIHRDLAMLIEQKIDDPRIRSVTLTAVKVSRDLGYAKVYYTSMDGELAEVKEGLDKAAPYLRHLLSAGMSTRTTPRLNFIYDESIERGRNMEALIREVVRPIDPDDDTVANPDTPDPS
jgi:ribosome-binding factor A